jgi:capsular polysaccharide biosynthesis protein
VRNEAKLLDILGNAAKTSGFEVVVFTDSPRSPPARAAFELFASAAAVVGTHGAGLANVVVCPPGTAVLELALPEEHAR